MTLNPINQRRILNQDYVSRRDLRELYGWSKEQAKKEFMAIQHQIEDEGKPMMHQGRTLLIPITEILKIYPLSYNKIDRAARLKIISLNDYYKEGN